MSLPQAVVLAAGMGTRLRSVAEAKPLAMVAGRSLIAHALAGLTEAGVGEIIVVLGYEGDRVAAHLAGITGTAPVRHVHNPDWQAPNGVSVLASAAAIRGRALLTMCDHLVDPALYARVGAAAREGLVLGVDRRIGHPWVDEEDVTRVETVGDAIVGIGKLIPRYDAYDTGVFAIDSSLFDALSVLSKPSVSAGVADLAGRGSAWAVDIGDLGWLDVDDPRALAIAQDWKLPG
jgi:1L-myo-inositol 1-phosphate cytidylyltransferase